MVSEDVYSEVYEILAYMDKTTVMKIPIDILQTIKEKRNKNYITKIEEKDIFNRNNVLPETIKYIAWLDFNFWESKEEQERLKKKYFENISKEEKQKSIDYGQYNLFENKNNETSNEKTKTMYIVEYKEKGFKKIFEFIKRLFKFK